MPFVQLRYRFERFGGHINPIIAALPAIVANALTCDDPRGKLTADDVEVEVIKVGPDDIFGYDLGVSVEATDFTPRVQTIVIRQHEIGSKVAKLLPYKGVRGFVWLTLVPSSFGEFACEETPEENQVISDCCRLGDHEGCDPNHPVCMGFGHFPECICDCHKQQSDAPAKLTICPSCQNDRHDHCDNIHDAQNPCKCPCHDPNISDKDREQWRIEVFPE